MAWTPGSRTVIDDPTRPEGKGSCIVGRPIGSMNFAVMEPDRLRLHVEPAAEARNRPVGIANHSGFNATLTAISLPALTSRIVSFGDPPDHADGPEQILLRPRSARHRSRG